MQYSPVLDSTYACIFMGTPHAGAGIAKIANTIADIAKLFVSVSRKNLRDLQENSPALQELSAEFGHLLRLRQEQGRGLKIIVFTETEKVKIGNRRILVSSEHMGE